ncbi:MAG TPA: FixH family protein [Xanthobacteraceae bacterium]|nr:FixH family protein [Xanthobacteraceae bacterium]
MSPVHSRDSDGERPAAVRQGKRPSGELTGRTVLVCLLAFFGVVLAANGLLVQQALSTFGGVETDSSYRAGQLFEREVAMARAQDAQHWQVEASVTPAADGSALVDIVARDAAGQALAGVEAIATFERPTDRRLDRSVAVSAGRQGHFRGSAALSPGQWDLVIELSRHGERQFRSKNRVVLR